MSDEAMNQGRFSQPVRQMVSTASDEQLAWIVGPDRRFYSKEAIAAATEELEIRRESNTEVEGELTNFNVAAFIFGPLWYFYHGMMGRGVLIFAVLLGAIFGLGPMAAAIGLPTVAWVILVILSVGGYCSRFADRDMRESRLQARLTARQPIVRPKNQKGPRKGKMVLAAEVGCRMAGEQAKALLETEGIRAIINCEDTGLLGPGSGSVTRSIIPAKVLVHEKDLTRSQELISALLSEQKKNLCEEDDSPDQSS